MATLSGIITPTNVLTASSTATLTNKTWNSNTIGVAYGGTGQTSYTNGQLLIGNTTGNTLTKATLTAGTGISITNGTGSITIASAGGGGATGGNLYLASNFGGF
jgi:trimeric autotransporter adhesin